MCVCDLYLFQFQVPQMKVKERFKNTLFDVYYKGTCLLGAVGISACPAVKVMVDWGIWLFCWLGNWLKNLRRPRRAVVPAHGFSSDEDAI